MAGVVEAVGADVTRFAPGDFVFARPRDGRIGTLAERIAVDQDDLARLPGNLSMTEAAGLPLVGLTAWQALSELGQVKPGQKVLIHAGSGGVGSIAIQLAKHLGATVATTASAASADLVRDLGADIVIDYRSEDFAEKLSGFDLVLCGLEGETLTKSLKVLKPGGLLISIVGPPTPAFARKQRLGWHLHLLMWVLSLGIRRKAKASGIRYEFLFMRSSGSQLAQLAVLFEAGAIRPVTDQVFPFEETNEAIAYLDGGHAKGKVIVALHADT